jgi:glycosyltransferase involved in cell wall biosynthesis
MIGPSRLPTAGSVMGGGRQKVLLVVEQLRRPIPGGIGRYAVGLLDGFRDLEADQHVAQRETPLLSLLVSRPSGGRGNEDPLAPWGLPIYASRLPNPLLTRAWDRGLLRAPRGFDVVHAVSLAVPPLHRHRRPSGRRSPKLSVVVHDVAWRLFPDATTKRGRTWHEAALHRALKRADMLVVPSERVADELRLLGPKAPISVVPLGSDHLPAPDTMTTAALLRHHDVQGEFLLTAGTLEPRKNLNRLFEAYRAARSTFPEPWPLLVVGPQGWGDAHTSVPEGVVPMGEVSDGVLAALYSSARVFLYVPLTEGYGLPPVEAMVFGVPVLASSGVPSVDVPAGAPAVAVRVDPLDPDAIAEGLVQVATDTEVRAEVAQAGRALAASRTWREVARQTISAWDSAS